MNGVVGGGRGEVVGGGRGEWWVMGGAGGGCKRVVIVVVVVLRTCAFIAFQVSAIEFGTKKKQNEN